MKAKKFIPIILALLLSFSLCACAERYETGDPIDIDSPGTTEEDVMTKDYQRVSKKYFEITGVQMPELKGVDADYEMLNKDPSNEEIEIEIAGDEEAFKTLKDAFQTELGTPFYEDSVSAIWKVNTENGIKVHSLLYDVGEPQIYLNYYPNKG